MRCLQQQTDVCKAAYPDVSMMRIKEAYVPAITVCDLHLYTPSCDRITVIENPGFETGDLTGWTDGSWGGSTASVISTSPHRGTYCLKCLSAGNAAGEVIQTLTTVVGITYTISAWYKGTAGYMYIWGGDPLGLTTVADWAQYSITFTADSDSAMLVLQSQQANGYVAYFDDISVRVGS